MIDQDNLAFDQGGANKAPREQRPRKQAEPGAQSNDPAEAQQQDMDAEQGSEDIYTAAEELDADLDGEDIEP